MTEKKLVLEVCGVTRASTCLKLAIEAAKVPALKDDAMAAALAIAQKMGGSEDVQKVLSQIGYEPVKIEIVKAEYGAGSTVQGRDGDGPQARRQFPADRSAVVQLQHDALAAIRCRARSSS